MKLTKEKGELEADRPIKASFKKLGLNWAGSWGNGNVFSGIGLWKREGLQFGSRIWGVKKTKNKTQHEVQWLFTVIKISRKKISFSFSHDVDTKGGYDSDFKCQDKTNPRTGNVKQQEEQQTERYQIRIRFQERFTGNTNNEVTRNVDVSKYGAALWY